MQLRSLISLIDYNEGEIDIYRNGKMILKDLKKHDYRTLLYSQIEAIEIEKDYYGKIHIEIVIK